MSAILKGRFERRVPNSTPWESLIRSGIGAEHPRNSNGPSLLSELTELTGGRAFEVTNASELADIAAKVGVELRNQYILGYHPSNKAHDARWRKIKVKLRTPKGLPPLNVHAKPGYYAPAH